MKIGFIGAGKVGYSLGKYFAEHNVCVSGYYSQNQESSKDAAKFTASKSFETMEQIIQECDTLFLTVPDGAIADVYASVAAFDIRGKIICHCSGSLSSEVFQGIKEKGAYGYSLHPIYAVSSKYESYREFSKVYFTLEGAEERRNVLQSLLEELGNPVEIIAKEDKARYHLAAVFASNLVTGLYRQATELMEECGLSRSFSRQALLPLFLGNANALALQGMAASLTGPIERADEITIQKHLEVMDEDAKTLYQQLSRKLVEISKEKNPSRDYKKIEELL